MKKTTGFYLILLMSFGISICPKAINAQTENNNAQIIISDVFKRLSEKGKGKIVISGDDVSRLIREHIASGKGSLRGCRIRVFRDIRQDSRQRVERVKEIIQREFPGMAVYTQYQSPYWYVDIGDFRSPEEAEKTKRALMNIYSGSSLITNIPINFPAL